MTGVRDDRLEGAEAIADYLGFPTRRVVYLREKGTDCPIRKLPGLGLYAFKSDLDAWLRNPATLSPEARKAS